MASCSTQFLDIATPADRAEELVRVASALSGKPEDTYRAVDGFYGLVSACVANIPAVMATAKDDEVQGHFFTLIFSFFKLLVADPQVSGLARDITAQMISSQERAALRLRILVDLYNVVGLPSVKLPTFLAIVRFAAATKQLELLTSYFAQASSWQSKWGISAAQARDLYLLISQCLTASGDVEQGQAFLIRYLATFEKESDAASIEAAKEHAVSAALGYVKAPALSQRSSLPQLAVVRALESDARYSRLHALLSIFASRDLDAYDEFQAANAAWLTSQGIDHASSRETMRLLTLCTLASSKPTLAYPAIAAGLKVEPSEVESWVVKAITRGLIDAKIDQAAGAVTVTRALQREFGPQHWAQLGSKLRQWRDSVSALLATMEGAGGSAPAARGGAGGAASAF